MYSFSKLWKLGQEKWTRRYDNCRYSPACVSGASSYFAFAVNRIWVFYGWPASHKNLHLKLMCICIFCWKLISSLNLWWTVPFARHPKKVPKVAQLATKPVQKDHGSSLSNNALTRPYRHNEWLSKTLRESPSHFLCFSFVVRLILHLSLPFQSSSSLPSPLSLPFFLFFYPFLCFPPPIITGSLLKSKNDYTLCSTYSNLKKSKKRNNNIAWYHICIAIESSS